MYRPIGNRLLVRRVPLPATSRGGIMVLGREYPTLATVLAVGSGPRTRDGTRSPITDIRVGDQVTFDKHAIETRLIPGTDEVAILDYDDCYLRLRRD